MGKRTRRVRVSGVPVCIALINRGSGAASCSSGEHSFKSQVGEHLNSERMGGESVGPNSDYRPSPLHGSKSRASSRLRTLERIGLARNTRAVMGIQKGIFDILSEFVLTNQYPNRFRPVLGVLGYWHI